MKNNLQLKINRKVINCFHLFLFLSMLLMTADLKADGNIKRVTLHYNNVPIGTVLAAINKQTNIGFGINEAIHNTFPSVSIHVENTTIDDALHILLKNSGYNYQIMNGIIVIKKDKNLSTSQQPGNTKISVRGIVKKGANNQGLSEVAIHIAGTTLGAITDKNGHFSITIDKGQKLVFSFIGMVSVEKTINNATDNLVVTMEEEVMDMDEVVVTGIFNRPRESYTGAVTTITEKDLKMYKGQNVLSTLRNIDPSINIVADNLAGSNPNREYEVNIRGNSSLPLTIEDLNESAGRQLNAPLVIMDGFEITLQKLLDFNDEEIESVNILKDASATAIYGARGANGVIVIKTKTPQIGRMKIYVQGGLNLEIPDLSSYDLLGAKEKLELERMVGLYDSETGEPESDRNMKELWNSRWNSALRGETNWLKEPVRVGSGQKLNLRLEGGSDEFRWSVSVGNNLVKGAMKGSKRNITNASITLLYRYKNLSFRNQASYGYTLADNGSYGKFSDYAKMNPYFRARDENGQIIESWSSFPYSVYNPLYDTQLNSKNESKITSVDDVFSIDWSVIEGLTVRGQLGLTKTFTTKDVYVPGEHSKFKNSSSYITGDNFFRKGTYDYTTGQSSLIEGSLTLSYSKTLNEKHLLYAGFNTTIAKSQNNSYYIQAEGLLNQNFDNFTNALQYKEGTSPSGSDSRTTRLGFTGNINYTYDNRYFIDGSFRLDGSSQFGTNNKYAPFWSMGTGWNIHNENFLQGQEIVDMIRLRLSYGQSGSQQFAAYQARSMYRMLTSNRYMFWTASELMGIGNKDLKWQKTDQWNAGIDSKFLNNRINLGLDAYYKKTSNLLSLIDIPLAQGFNSYAENVGEVKNYGIEGTLGGYIVRNTEHGLMWSLTGKLAYTKNKITKLSEAIKEQVEARKNNSDYEYDKLLYEGHSQNSIYAVRSQGIDPVDGREIFLDKNGNITKTWNAADRIYCGVGEPTYRGSLSSLLSYKGLSLNLSFAFHWGGVQYNKTLIDKVEVFSIDKTNLPNSYEGSIMNNVDSRVYSDRWQKAGDVKFFKGYSNERTRSSTRFVMDDKAFELQSASLQYRWNTSFVKKNLHAETINFNVNMSDVFYLSSIKRERGLEYPFARNVQLAISLIF